MKLKINPKLIYIIEAFFTALAFSSATKVITPEEISALTQSSNSITYALAKLQLNYLNGYGVNISIIFLVMAYFFYKVNDNSNKKDKRLNVISVIAGIIFATCMIIGNRFLYDISMTIDTTQILITVINFIGYFFLFKNIFVFIINSLKNKT